MHQNDEIERIEVELYATEADPSSPFPGPWELGESSAPAVSVASRRPVAVLVAVAAVAAVSSVVGWAVVRSRGESPAAAPGEVGPAATEPVVDRAAGGRSTGTVTTEVAGGSPLVPMAPVTPALGDAEPIVEAVVGVSAVLAAQQLEIVAFGNGRQLLRLDLSTGILRTQIVQRHAFGRARVLAGTDWVLLPTPDPDLHSLVVAADGTVELVEHPPDRTVLGVSDREQVWLADPDVLSAGGRIEAVTGPGDPLGTIELPGPPDRLDPRGGFVVVDDTGGADQVSAKASVELTTGDLLAIGVDHVVAVECSGRSCDTVVIDRSSGRRRVIEPSRAGVDDPPELSIIGVESVAPGGRHAMVAVLDPIGGSSVQTTLATLDLVDGEVIEVGRAQDVDESVWSPDGRFLFYNGGGRIRAHDVTTGREIDVSSQLVAIDSFSVRPPLGDDGF